MPSVIGISSSTCCSPGAPWAGVSEVLMGAIIAFGGKRGPRREVRIYVTAVPAGVWRGHVEVGGPRYPVRGVGGRGCAHGSNYRLRRDTGTTAVGADIRDGGTRARVTAARRGGCAAVPGRV